MLLPLLRTLQLADVTACPGTCPRGDGSKTTSIAATTVITRDGTGYLVPPQERRILIGGAR